MTFFRVLYSMKIKEQTKKLATGCSKHCFEVQIELTWFEEILEEYKFEIKKSTISQTK